MRNRLSIDSFIKLGFLVATVLFAVAVIDGFGDRFFDPTCGHNDTRQQVFQFQRALIPELFAHDLVYDSMTAYLPPAHYWLGMLLTKISGSPLMAAHLMMSMQVLLTMVGLFLSVRMVAGFVPACVALIWFLNSRHVLLLMAGGLPRGWIAPILAIYLYAAISSAGTREWRVWGWLLVAAVLNPVATFIGLLSHSTLHGIRFLQAGERLRYFRERMVPFAFAALTIAATVWITTARSPELGRMATLAEASRLQGFSKRGGRFPILPLSDPWHEFQAVGLQAFVGPWLEVSDEAKRWIPVGVVLVLGLFTAMVGVRLKRGGKIQDVVPLELYALGVAIAIGYFLARPLAFNLYIPERYLGSPLTIFFICFFTVGIWRLSRSTNEAAIDVNGQQLKRYGVLSMMLAILFCTAGVGTRGEQMFDSCYARQATLWDFMQRETPRDSIVAGHPTLLDGLMLFGARQGYITTETAHPFYDAYYKEVKRRLEIVFTAHYAHSWEQLYRLLAPEGIDYFVFRRSDFTPERIHRERYEIPFFNLLKRLNAAPLESYVYSQLPAQVDRERLPFFVLRTESAAVIDVSQLGAYLKESSRSVH